MKNLYLDISRAVKLADAARQMKCAENDLLIKAANCELLIHVSLKPHKAKLCSVSSELDMHSNVCINHWSIQPLLPQYAEDIAFAGRVEIKQYEADLNSEDELNYWILDKPQIVDLSRLYISKDCINKSPDNTKLSKNEMRDTDYQEWLNTDKPDIDNMKKDDIEAILIKRNPKLWRQGFENWYRQSDIKKKGGRPKKTR